MTKYRLDRDPDTGKPCMVADPGGIYYSAGEVDRKIDEMERLIWRLGEYAKALEQTYNDEFACHFCDCGLEGWPHKPDCQWLKDIKAAQKHTMHAMRAVEFTDAIDFSTDDPIIRAWMEGKRDEAGTHDGGTVPEGDRSSTGPASARESEDHSE